jgi:hypothetical protein
MEILFSDASKDGKANGWIESLPRYFCVKTLHFSTDMFGLLLNFPLLLASQTAEVQPNKHDAQYTCKNTCEHQQVPVHS